MARRSPLNRRYQKDARVGSTRKSAAAAKPKRSSGSASSSSTSRSRSGSSRGSSSRVQLPPEIKRLQKISFGMLGAAVVLSALYLWQGRAMGPYGYIIIGFAYALMFGALYIDFRKVRPALKAGQRGSTAAGSGKPQSTKAAAPKKESPEKTADFKPDDD